MNVLFVDQAGCYNRGCEAIVRSFATHLREHYGPFALRILSATADDDQRRLADLGNVECVPLRPANVSAARFLASAASRLGNKRLAYRFLYRHTHPHYAWADAVFEVGGDTFGKDYGGAWGPLELVRLGRLFGRITAVQGASIGPFPERPQYEYAREVLGSLDLVCARDSLSYEYVREMGLTNVELVADPAFHLACKPPADVALPDDRPLVGVGLSAGFPRYLGMDANAYADASVRMVESLLRETDVRIVLVPHVFFNEPRPDDFTLSQQIYDRLQGTGRLWMLPHRSFNCMELKYIIGRCEAFIGARMHAAIAAVSQCVPTVLLAYSRKAPGLLKDVYGHDHYALQPAALLDGTACRTAVDLLANREAIREAMAPGVARMKERSKRNGDLCVALLRRTAASSTR